MNDSLKKNIDTAFEGSTNKTEFLNGINNYVAKLSLLNNNQDNINIKLFLTDVDGVLTDAGMYYSENGDELKKFNTRDGKAFELLRNAGIKTGIITSENTKIVEARAKKLKVDYLFQGALDKLPIIKEICDDENISISDVAYIGDDLNDELALRNVGFAFCPQDARIKIKNVQNIKILKTNGGDGAVREAVDFLLNTI
jgi:YrbI family 3-deoxy-D-manno-octulosonate 8-phosphate phosphatase